MPALARKRTIGEMLDAEAELYFQPDPSDILRHIADGGKRARMPEEKLLLAILERAAADLKDRKFLRSRKTRWQAMILCDWITSRSRDWVLPFATVCEYLSLDPDYLRKGLLGQTPKRPRPLISPTGKETAMNYCSP